MDVVALSDLDAARRDAVTALLRRADDADDHPSLPEPQYHALADDDGGTRHEGRLVLAERADVATANALAGLALLTPARDGSTTLHVVTDPALGNGTVGADDADGLASALTGAAVALADEDGTGRPLHLWAMQAGPADDERAKANGFVPERDVIQMRVPLPLADSVLRATRPLATRPFAPGKDDEAWLRVNNRAFAEHPEQGSWTLEQLHERLAADWVDLEGFLVADDPEGDGLVGFCWTKIHRNRDPVLGEIYVIGVDPAHHGGGLGRALTVAGLNSMADRGVHVGMLYTDDSNQAAVALYGKLGFTVDHVDRSYRRAGTSATTPA